MKVCSVFKSSSDLVQESEFEEDRPDGQTGSGSSDFFDPSYENYTQPSYPFTFV